MQPADVRAEIFSGGVTVPKKETYTFRKIRRKTIRIPTQAKIIYSICSDKKFLFEKPEGAEAAKKLSYSVFFA